MRATGASVPDFLLEQYALGELGVAEEARVAQALRSDAALRLRLEELAASNAVILAEAPPAQIAAAIRRRMLSSSGGATRGAVFKPSSTLFFAAAAAVLVLAGAVYGRALLFPTAQELSRPKGGAPGLSIYKKTAAGSEELRDGSPAAPGDILQIRYSAAGERHGAIISLDGRGTLTVHLPEGQAATAGLLAPAGSVLGSAYELDDAPGFERFFILSSRSAFDLKTALAALHDLASKGDAISAAPALPAGMEWKSFLVIKTGAGR